MVRFVRTATEGARRGASAARWSPPETVALLQAVEPWGGPEQTGSVTVRDRIVEIRPAPGAPAHEAQVRCGQLAAALDVALRAMGWVPRVHIADGTAPALVTLFAGGRRAATTRDLARRRAEHRWLTGTDRHAGRVDGRTVVRIAQGAEAGGGRLCLVNGPYRDGAPAWCTPGRIPEQTWGLDLPWRRDPVLAACTRGEGPEAAALAGLVAHRAGVEAAVHAHRAVLHPLPRAEAPPAAVHDLLSGGATNGAGPWRVHALVHVRP